MSKYFDGYAKFDYKEMSKEKLITELKEKVRYIGELKRNNDKEIAKVQSIKDKTIADLEAKLAESESIREINRKGALEEIKILHKRINEIVDRDNNIIKNLNQQLAEKEKEIAKSVIFPKLEKAYGHTGWWYLYELDYKGDICCTSFEATKKEAEQELRKAQHKHEDKGE